MRPVVNAHRAPLGSAFFQKVNAYPVTAPDDSGSVYPEVAQGVHRRLTDGVLGQLGHINGVKAEVGKTHRHIGFAPAEGCLHLIVLEKAVIAVGGQPQHNFAERDYLFHTPLISFTSATACAVRFSISSNRPSLMREAGTIQLPPQANTAEQVRYSLMFFSLMPPVGINRTPV